MLFSAQFTSAFVMDLLFGDPRSLPHPVRGMGLFCSFFEEQTRSGIGNERLAGTFSFLLVIAATLLPLFVILALLYWLFPALEAAVAVLLVYSGIACRDLTRHALAVYGALVQQEGVQGARTALQMIVGRDTRELNEEGICRGTVETVAENLVDGVLSPIFFGILVSCLPLAEVLSPIGAAAVGVYLYKAVNTMDSMYGYKNERYLHFGTTAARMDDFFNFVPARLSGPFLLLAAFVMGLDWKNGLRVFRRDRLRHASPNGGHPESAVAGILGVRLGGNSVYFGKVHEKQTLGDGDREIDKKDILLTCRLLVVSSILFLGASLLVRYLFFGRVL